MQLARAAAARTLADWAEPAAPPPATEPLTADAVAPSPQQAVPPAMTEPAPRTNPAPRRLAALTVRPTDPALLFTRLAATVRDCIALETRIAAGGPSAPNAPIDRTARANPRRALLREAFGIITKNHPDRTELMREAATRIDEQLAANPDPTIDPGRFLMEICEDLGIELNLHKLADKYLFASPVMTDPDDDAPDPHATYPP